LEDGLKPAIQLLMKMNPSQTQGSAQPQRSPEGTTVLKIVGAGVTGTLAFVAAVFTTVVETGGFWQYFWLGICVLLFVSALSLVILASREGLRIDHAGLSFEPRDRQSAADRERR
jgi:hypothetical protein